MVLLFLISFFFLLDIRIVNFICSDLCDFAIHTPINTPLISNVHPIHMKISRHSISLFTHVMLRLTCYILISEQYQYFLRLRSILVYFLAPWRNKLQFWTISYIHSTIFPILFQRPILFNLSRIRESNKNSKDSYAQ